jgi:CubicO group peptidase (beta-lactamase class C family)
MTFSEGGAGGLLPRSTPEAEGLPSGAVRAFVDGAEEQVPGLHSLMLLRHGHVIAEGWWEPYGPDTPHLFFSLSKSFTSTAAGLAVGEGRLSLDDDVLSFFPDDAPAAPGPHLRALKVRHLLAMATGHTGDTVAGMSSDPDGRWARGFLAQEPEKEPGTHFFYNNGATYMVSAIVQKVTGQTLLEYLTPRLLEPLGIAGATWESSPEGVNLGGWGLSARTEDIAKFGELYRNDGVWGGRRLLPEGWVADATAKHVSNGDDPENDWHQGYGFQFWRCRHGAYRGDGAFGQFCVVMPEQEAVLAVTAGVRDMGAVLRLAWEHLLPAFAPAPLPPDPAAHAALTERLAHLRLAAPEGAATSPLANAVNGRTYRFDPNEEGVESLTTRFTDGGGVTATLRDKNGAHEMSVGAPGEWRCGESGVLGGEGRTWRHVAVAGAWTAPQVYTAAVCAYETPFVLTYTLRFSEDGARVTVDAEQNVGFGPTKRATLTGVAE